MTAAGEYTGTIMVTPQGHIRIDCSGSGSVLDLACLMRDWDGRRARVIVAEGGDMRWIVIEMRREGDGIDGQETRE